MTKNINNFCTVTASLLLLLLFLFFPTISWPVSGKPLLWFGTEGGFKPFDCVETRQVETVIMDSVGVLHLFFGHHETNHSTTIKPFSNEFMTPRKDKTKHSVLLLHADFQELIGETPPLFKVEECVFPRLWGLLLLKGCLAVPILQASVVKPHGSVPRRNGACDRSTWGRWVVSGYQTPSRNWGHVRKECADKQQRWRNKQWNGLKNLKRPVINNRCWSCEQDENTSGQECQGLTHGYTAIYPLYISGTLPVAVIIGVTLADVEIGSKITPHSLSIYEIIWNW